MKFTTWLARAFLVLTAAVCCCSGGNLCAGHVPAAVRRLQPVGDLPATNRLKLAIGLPLRNAGGLSNLLQRLYDPASPDYRQFLTAEQFRAQFCPTEEDYRTLRDFAAANGLQITGTHSNRLLLDVSASVADVQKFFHVRLHSYHHPTENRDFYAPDSEPSLNVPVSVLHVSGLDNFVLPHPMNLRASAAAKSPTPNLGSGPGGSYLGNDFRAAYIPGTTLTGAGQAVGLLEFDGYFPGDVAAYRSLSGLPAVPLKNVLLDGFDGSAGNNNAEVSLDINMANDMAPGLAAIIVYEGEVPDDVLNRMATDNLARQLSASWLYPIDAETEQIFQEFAAQGQSFFNASGDYDAYSSGVDTPADDPYITVVGGTTLSTSGPGGAWVSETVWNWGSGTGTGGGTSTTYAIPWWQQSTSMASNGGSTLMRNLPDVALTADNVFLFYNDGISGIFGGTSCATPLWAAFTALVNQQAAGNGQPGMGFINPVVYTLGNSVKYNSAFHDITTGNNTSASSPAEFYAVPGYDLCTGWGTPAGTNLINLLAPPDALGISPAGGIAFNGGPSGPFSPTWTNFVLTNSGASSLIWSAGNSPSWLGVAPAGGTLPAGASVSVALNLNTSASNKVAGTYAAPLWFTNLSDGVVQSRPLMLNVLAPPKITLNPSNQSVLGGTTAAFTGQGIGSPPLSFQWRQNGTNLADGGDISGSSTTTLTISNVGLANAGSYTIAASNAAGTAISSPGVLTVIPSAPVITAQPAGQFALLGQVVHLTVSALGNAPLSFQWKRNGANLTDGGNISGSSTGSLSISAAAATNAGTYAVTITNSLGSTNSAAAVLSVYALADSQLLENGGFETGDFSFWNQSGNSVFDTVSSGGIFVHSGLYGAEMGAVGSPGYLSQTAATVPGANYLLSFWVDSPDGDGPNELLAAWGGYTLMDATNLPAFGWTNCQFVVTATASNTTVEIGMRDDTSFLGLDDVSLEPLANPNGAPVITAQPATQTYAAAGSTAMLTVTAAGETPLFYQWRSNNIALFNATNATLVFSNIAATQTAVYSVTVTNALGSITSSNANLFVLTGNEALVTFDDLASTNPTVPDGYANLNWSNFYYVDPLTSAPNPSGYVAGAISQPNVAYNGDGTTASISSPTPFDFLSAWFTAAWNDGLRLEIKGYASNGLAYDQAFTLSATNPMQINVNCIGVTNIHFSSSGGSPDSAYSETGFEFVMDNASIIASPLPPPANDLCGNAIVISSNPYTNMQSTVGATAIGDPSFPCASGFTNAVWYRFAAPDNGYLALDTIGSDYAAALAVYTGVCGALNQVVCEPSAPVPVLAGTTYYILIAGAVPGNLVFHATFSSATVGPPLILSQPASTEVLFGNSANFAILAAGAPPLTYTWKRNGVTVASGGASSYTLNNAQLSDSGAQFSCVVGNALGAAASSAAALTVSVPGQLAQNGGFETGDFTGWTLSGNTNDVSVNTMFVHSGRYGAALGPAGSLGYLSQTLSTTPGRWYSLSLWLDSPSAMFPNEFSVTWNGNILFDQTNIGGVGWTNLVFAAPATASGTVLQVGFRDDPSFLGLDDVSVLPLNPILQDVTRAGSMIHFSWNAAVGFPYQIQSTTNLARTNWTTVATVTATNLIMTMSEPVNSSGPIFYRVITAP